MIRPRKAGCVTTFRKLMKTASLLCILTLTVCLHAATAADEKVAKKLESAPQIVDTVELLAVLKPTEGNSASGVITFTTLPDGKVLVAGQVSGLTPNSEHGFHIHQYGDIRSADGTSLGDHYDPLHMEHAMPTAEMRHAGDFGNIKANDQGVAEVKLVVDNISLSGQKSPIIGRGLVVHANRDDGSQPTGNAGARIAVGVIGVLNPEAK